MKEPEIGREDTDISQTASYLIEAYGENACAEAAMLANYALNDKDVKTANFWLCVLRVLIDLEYPKPGPSEPLN